MIARTQIPMVKFASVYFHRFKAFKELTLPLKQFNILVGPNNSGKSTIIAAFRMLYEGMRKARARRPEVINALDGEVFGYRVNMKDMSVAEENVFFNYDSSDGADVVFTLSNKNTLRLHFPREGECYLITHTPGRPVRSPSEFNKHFNCPINFVPILGPVEHEEDLHEPGTARQALLNYRAARNFRNIWYHFPEKFDAFRALLRQTWPGMDVLPPERANVGNPPKLYMYCPEQRIDREIFWSGFGFQVWCQMLTHLVQASHASVFLIDEPDIYLHSDLQRQLLGILRNLGPDIVIATHSVDMIIDAEPNDIIVVNKDRASVKRVKKPEQVSEVLSILGSNLNLVLTQIAKTRKVVFVEGKDFQILSKFGRKSGATAVSNRSKFAVVPVDGFNLQKAHNFGEAMKHTLGVNVKKFIVFDKDYRSEVEIADLVAECSKFCDEVSFHDRKEVENFLLIPAAIDRAIERRLVDKAERSGEAGVFEPIAALLLEKFVEETKDDVRANFISFRLDYVKRKGMSLAPKTATTDALKEFDKHWKTLSDKLLVVSGKAAMSYVNMHVQQKWGVSITPTAIVDAMLESEVPSTMQVLVDKLEKFSRS